MIKNQSRFGTLASKILDKNLYENPNVVKVITKENLHNKNFHNLNLSSYIALMPPSILISAPVINFDSSLAKNKTV